jgi:hypothetical protein
MSIAMALRARLPTALASASWKTWLLRLVVCLDTIRDGAEAGHDDFPDGHGGGELDNGRVHLHPGCLWAPQPRDLPRPMGLLRLVLRPGPPRAAGRRKPVRGPQVPSPAPARSVHRSGLRGRGCWWIGIGRACHSQRRSTLPRSLDSERHQRGAFVEAMLLSQYGLPDSFSRTQSARQDGLAPASRWMDVIKPRTLLEVSARCQVGQEPGSVEAHLPAAGLRTTSS